MAKCKLTEELIANIYDELSEGTPVKYVCDYFGINDTTYYGWLKQGEEDDKSDVESLYAAFYNSIKKACAAYVISARKKVQAGAPGWQGTAWWLERTKNDFMPKQQIQADEDGKVIVNIGGKVKDVVKK